MSSKCLKNKTKKDANLCAHENAVLRAEKFMEDISLKFSQLDHMKSAFRNAIYANSERLMREALRAMRDHILQTACTLSDLIDACE